MSRKRVIAHHRSGRMVKGAERGPHPALEAPVGMTKRVFVERLIRRDEDDGSFDREFWQKLGHEAIFAAAWEMVAEVDLIRGGDGRQPRLQRSVEHLQRRRR